MKKQRRELYDQAELSSIKKRLSEELLSGNKGWKNNALQYLLAVVEEIADENESLWFMLDEEKNSKPNAKHTELLNDLVQNRITYLKMIQGRKGEA